MGGISQMKSIVNGCGGMVVWKPPQLTDIIMWTARRLPGYSAIWGIPNFDHQAPVVVALDGDNDRSFDFAPQTQMTPLLAKVEKVDYSLAGSSLE